MESDNEFYYPTDDEDMNDDEGDLGAEDDAAGDAADDAAGDDDTDLGAEDDGYDIADFGEDDANLKIVKKPTILSAGEIKMRQDEHIKQVSAILSLTTDESCILLHQYNWDARSAQEAWVANESNVRVTLGLPAVKVANPPKASKVTCGICFDDHDDNTIASTGCGHWYCVECWKGYIGSAVADGSGCLSLRCPEPSCTSAVTRTMIYHFLINAEDRDRYNNYFLRSYVEGSRKMKWCPSADCECAAELDSDQLNVQYEVQCKCLHRFCWNCVEDAHRPVDCDTVAKWILKNTSEAENTQWILCYTKPCPKCKRPIEKNDGCMHMTCREPCRYQFCWLCLGPWEKHGSYYACNTYKTENDKDELVRNRARESLQRYTHYYERWAFNEKSRLKAVEDLHSYENVKLEQLRNKLNLTIRDVEFVGEAWKQIVECRQILQWTYTYGYYYMDGSNKYKKQYFEHEQGVAERALEDLHHYAQEKIEGEKAIQNVTKDNFEEFQKFQFTLVNKANVARKYFNDLVRDLETGLQGVTFEDHWQEPHEAGTTSSSNFAAQAAVRLWQCKTCTLVNETHGTVCDTCLTCNLCTYCNPFPSEECQMCGEDGEDAVPQNWY